MDTSVLKGLPVVQLQLLDELTGEALEFVNPITIATKVFLDTAASYIAEGENKDVDTALAILFSRLSQVSGTMYSDQAAFESHINNKSELTKYDKDNNLVNPYGEGVHARKDLLDMCIIDREYDTETGVATYTRYDGTTFTWDSAIEFVPVHFGWCENDSDHPNSFFLETDGGERQYIDFTRLVDVYRGIDNPESPVITNVVNNIIAADIRVSSIKLKHLADEVNKYLTDSDRFIKAYEEKIKGIEEGANKYILPTAKSETFVPEPVEGETEEEAAIDKRLGGVIAGHNISVDDEGVINAINIMYGESVDTAVPVNLFMKIIKTGGPSTDPIPTLTARTSYVTTEGNFFIWNEGNATYDYISASTDGTRITNLPIEDASKKLYNGLELIDSSTLTWYHDDMYNYAITQNGDGFRYDLNNYVFVEPYVTKEEFIAIVNSGNYVHGPSEGLPSLKEVRADGSN